MPSLFDAADLPAPRFSAIRRHPAQPPFWRASVRYEVALDVLGAVISHCAEVIALEREKADCDAGAVALHAQVQAQIRALRDRLDPHDPAVIEAVIAHYAPLARRLFATPDTIGRERRRAQFAQVNASLALEGLHVNADDLALQERIILGEICADEAAALLLDRFGKSAH